MKSIVALVIFAIIIAFSSGLAVAESNPLLTVFEALSTGEYGIKAADVEKAINRFRSPGNAISSAKLNITDGRNLTISWVWKNSTDADVPAHIIATATLEIVVFWEGGFDYDMDRSVVMSQRIQKATYRYKFFDLGRIMIK